MCVWWGGGGGGGGDPYKTGMEINAENLTAGSLCITSVYIYLFLERPLWTGLSLYSLSSMVTKLSLGQLFCRIRSAIRPGEHNLALVGDQVSMLTHRPTYGHLKSSGWQGTLRVA